MLSLVNIVAMPLLVLPLWYNGALDLVKVTVLIEDKIKNPQIYEQLFFWSWSIVRRAGLNEPIGKYQ